MFVSLQYISTDNQKQIIFYMDLLISILFVRKLILNKCAKKYLSSIFSLDPGIDYIYFHKNMKLKGTYSKSARNDKS